MAVTPEPETGAKSKKWWIAAVVLVLLGAGAVALYAAGNYGDPDRANMTQASENRTDGTPMTQARTIDEAAQAGLSTLRALAGGAEYRALGFASSEEVGSARLGEPYEIFMIRLDQLRAYGPGSPADTLLSASPDTLFPIMVGGEARASMTVTRTDGGFVASEMGGTGRMQASVRARNRAAGDFIVRVPALGLQFIGNRADGRLMLTAIAADPRLRLEPGRPVPAETVLEQLVPIARAYNAEPM